MAGDPEFRRALALCCSDALAATDPLTPEAVEAIRTVLLRLVKSEPVTFEDEGEMLRVLHASCELTLPFDRGALARPFREQGDTK